MPDSTPIPHPSSEPNRRTFLKSSTSAVVAGGIAGSLAIARTAHAAGSDVLKVGLIGCGGRGSGAAKNALSAGEDIKLVAMGDVFADRLQASRNSLVQIFGERVDVPDERTFSGFDAYQQVLACDIDVVILTTPPHFRPAHLAAAVAAGKHVFCEKPVAVDAPGVRSVLDSCKQAEKKGLSVVSGLCWRYDARVRETMGRIKDGAIGETVAIQENYNTGFLWMHPRRDDWSDMEWQLRNWLYFSWLSGDHNVEQHIHSLDKGMWLMGDQSPVSAIGLGGRQVRTEPAYGHIFDHHAVVYEFPGGTKMFSFCRQQRNCANDVSDYFFGTKGRCRITNGIGYIEGETGWTSPRTSKNMYQVEHDELFEGIRKGRPINNGHYMANSTMVAILGRLATYTGKEVTWEEAFNSETRLGPEKYEWGPLETPAVAVPGVTTIA